MRPLSMGHIDRYPFWLVRPLHFCGVCLQHAWFQMDHSVYSTSVRWWMGQKRGTFAFSEQVFPNSAAFQIVPVSDAIFRCFYLFSFAPRPLQFLANLPRHSGCRVHTHALTVSCPLVQWIPFLSIWPTKSEHSDLFKRTQHRDKTFLGLLFTKGVLNEGQALPMPLDMGMSYWGLWLTNLISFNNLCSSIENRLFRRQHRSAIFPEFVVFFKSLHLHKPLIHFTLITLVFINLPTQYHSFIWVCFNWNICFHYFAMLQCCWLLWEGRLLVPIALNSQRFQFVS